MKLEEIMEIISLQKLISYAADPACPHQLRADICNAIKKDVLPSCFAEAYRRLIDEIFKQPDQIMNSAHVLCLICGEVSKNWQPHMVFTDLLIDISRD